LMKICKTGKMELMMARNKSGNFIEK